MQLICERYADFGPTLACEKLRKCHGLTLSKQTARRLMTEVVQDAAPAAARGPSTAHRRACYGEPIQIDGSDHAWFEDRAPTCTLLVFIDDATSRLMQLHFVPTESTFAYFEAARGYLERYGKPVALYSDKASIFRATQESTRYGRGATQFGRALYALNIDTFAPTRAGPRGASSGRT